MDTKSTDTRGSRIHIERHSIDAQRSCKEQWAGKFCFMRVARFILGSIGSIGWRACAGSFTGMRCRFNCGCGGNPGAGTLGPGNDKPCAGFRHILASSNYTNPACHPDVGWFNNNYIQQSGESYTEPSSHYDDRSYNADRQSPLSHHGGIRRKCAHV